MKYTLWSFLLALPLLALSSRGVARGAGGLPIKIDAGINYRFNVTLIDRNSIPKEVPWYLYWPYEAHLQMPVASARYPSWPAQAAGLQAPPSDALRKGPGELPLEQGPPLPVPFMPRASDPIQPQSFVQPVGYYRQVPSYWYSR